MVEALASVATSDVLYIHKFVNNYLEIKEVMTLMQDVMMPGYTLRDLYGKTENVTVNPARDTECFYGTNGYYMRPTENYRKLY